MKIRQMKNGLSLIPETDFEAESLAKMFVGNEQRKVIVKTGSSLADIQSIDIVVSNEKLYTLGKGTVYNFPHPDNKVFPEGCIQDLLEQMSKNKLRG